MISCRRNTTQLHTRLEPPLLRFRIEIIDVYELHFFSLHVVTVLWKLKTVKKDAFRCISYHNSTDYDIR